MTLRTDRLRHLRERAVMIRAHYERHMVPIAKIAYLGSRMPSQYIDNGLFPTNENEICIVVTAFYETGHNIAISSSGCYSFSIRNPQF